jgi:hypothetical protein
MEKPAITVIINGKTYRIRADAPEAIRAIPEADRAALVELLRVVDGQPLPAAAPRPAPAPLPVPTSPSATPPPEVPVSAKEIDAMVNRLIREERANQSSLPTAQTIYLWAGGIVVLLFLLMVIV